MHLINWHFTRVYINLYDYRPFGNVIIPEIHTQYCVWSLPLYWLQGGNDVGGNGNNDKNGSQRYFISTHISIREINAND